MQKISLLPQRGFFPQPMFLVGTYKEDGVPNYSLITWITFCSVNPPMLLFASRGKKLTRELIEKNGIFSANLVTEKMMYMADYFGNVSGYDNNKCSDINVAFLQGKELNVPILDESPWVYECKLIEIVKKDESYIYIGEVKNIQADESLKDFAYGSINLDKINPLIYAPGKYYGVTTNIGNVGYSLHDMKF